MDLFNYNSLNVSLDKKYRSITVGLDRPRSQNRINQEILFELETFFNWVSAHLEINSIVLTSSSDIFSQGLDWEELKDLDSGRFLKFIRRIQRLVYQTFFLPQTLIVDFGKQVCGVGVELALGADIRIIHEQGSLTLDHLLQGLSPCAGGLGVLSAIIPKSVVKSWVLSACPIESDKLIQSGFVTQTYSTKNPLNQYLDQINQQAPVQRIQAKRNFLEIILPELEKNIDSEKHIGQATLSCLDWKRFINQNHFLSAMEFSQFLKQESEMA